MKCKCYSWRSLHVNCFLSFYILMCQACMRRSRHLVPISQEYIAITRSFLTRDRQFGHKKQTCIHVPSCGVLPAALLVRTTNHESPFGSPGSGRSMQFRLNSPRTLPSLQVSACPHRATRRSGSTRGFSQTILVLQECPKTFPSASIDRRAPSTARRRRTRILRFCMCV